MLNSPPTRNETKAECLHLFYRVSNGSSWSLASFEVRLSLSLCSTAVEAILRNVTVSSSNNRTKPSPKVHEDSSLLTFADVRRHLGQDRSLAPDDRGILGLQKDDWVLRRAAATCNNSEGVLEFINAAMQTLPGLGFPCQVPSILFTTSTGDFMLSHDIYADPNITMLFQEILNTGGAVPFALQSAVTILTGMAYYDQVLFFDRALPASQTLLEQRLIPGGQPGFLAAPAGLLPGLLSFLCLLALHCIIVSVVSWMFFYGECSLFVLGITYTKHHQGTSISTLYNTWQSIAQLQIFPIDGYLAQATMVSDKIVEEWIRTDGSNAQYVGIGPSQSKDGTQIVGLRQRTTTSSRDSVSSGRVSLGGLSSLGITF